MKWFALLGLVLFLGVAIAPSVVKLASLKDTLIVRFMVIVPYRLTCPQQSKVLYQSRCKGC